MILKAVFKQRKDNQINHGKFESISQFVEILQRPNPVVRMMSHG